MKFFINKFFLTKKGFSIELSLAVDNNDLSRLEYLLPLTADIMFGIR